VRFARLSPSAIEPTSKTPDRLRPTAKIKRENPATATWVLQLEAPAHRGAALSLLCFFLLLCWFAVRRTVLIGSSFETSCGLTFFLGAVSG
jgi:hypothetical protein